MIGFEDSHLGSGLSELTCIRAHLGWLVTRIPLRLRWQRVSQVNPELQRLFPHPTSDGRSYTQDTRNGDNLLSCHYASSTLWHGRERW
jgi:hypothetical protein